MNKISAKDMAVLQEALASGILNIEDVQQVLNMKKEEYYLSLHKYDIYEGKDGNGTHICQIRPRSKGGES